MYAQILMGPYAGEILTIPDATGAAGVTDGWANNLAGDAYPFVWSGINLSPYVEWPQSMRTWLLGLGYVDTSGKVPIASLSNANPAVVTVAAGDIGKFTNGQQVTVSGTGTAADGVHTIGTITGNTFPLTGVNLSGLGAPVTNKGYVKP